MQFERPYIFCLVHAILEVHQSGPEPVCQRVASRDGLCTGFRCISHSGAGIVTGARVRLSLPAQLVRRLPLLLRLCSPILYRLSHDDATWSYLGSASPPYLLPLLEDLACFGLRFAMHASTLMCLYAGMHGLICECGSLLALHIRI